MPQEIRRRHARIEVKLACALATSEACVEGLILNLALGGAAVAGPEGIARLGESLGLSIEREFPDNPISLTGEIVRLERRAEQFVYCMRFVSIPPADHAELVTLLKALAHGRGEGRRAFRRVAHRLDLTCKSLEAFQATLKDISHGGLALETAKPLLAGDEVSVVLGTSERPGLTDVTGTVVHVEELQPGLWRGGIQFAPLMPEKEAQLAALIDILLGLGARQALIEDDREEDDEEVIEGEVV